MNMLSFAAKYRFNSLIMLCCAAFLVLALPLQAQRVSLDRIIAIVDEGVILQSDLDRRIVDVTRQAEASNRPIPPADELEEQVLETLILENLQMQLASRTSIRFDDDTLNRVLASMADQSNMSFDQYISALEAEGVYRQTREQVRQELTIRELQRGLVNSRISITDQEIDNFINSEMGRSTMAADYLVDHLVVGVAANDSPNVVEAKLQYASELVALVEEGTDLSAVRNSARQEGRFAVAGTNFGWRRIEQIPSLFTEIVPEMEVNEVAGPIRAGNGFHIISLVDVQGGTNRLVNQTRLRHIMVVATEIRTEEQAKAFADSLYERIKDGENFADIARQNSDDVASVVGGGDLGWVDDGGMPPEMQLVADSMEIGEMSEPFRSATGWHIVEVLERREEDISQQYSREQAENTLRGRKFDLELQNWLIEIREAAFVELKD
jgi:peptidyl-prolyl cis-trans isomerase SurA